MTEEILPRYLRIPKKTRTVVLAAATLVVIVLFSVTTNTTSLSMSSKIMAVAQQSDNTTTVTPTENTVKVNATETNEVYRWQINGQINPDLRVVANTAYTFTVQNPTDTTYELIIADSQGKKLGTTGDIQPGGSGMHKIKTFKLNLSIL